MLDCSKETGFCTSFTIGEVSKNLLEGNKIIIQGAPGDLINCTTIIGELYEKKSMDTIWQNKTTEYLDYCVLTINLDFDDKSLQEKYWNSDESILF